MRHKINMKNKLITGVVVLAAIALISGASIIAFASPGSQDDPFITLSYLMEEFRPMIMAEISKKEQELTQEFEDRIAALEAEFQAGQGGVGTPGSADTFAVVTLKRNQTLSCSVGAEIMLRIGTATGVGSVPALVNSTSGTTLSAGSALAANNMYLVTIDGNGLKATAENTRVLVRGSYRITG